MDQAFVDIEKKILTLSSMKGIGKTTRKQYRI